MAGGTDIDIHWALSCLTLMSFDSAAEFQVTEVPAVSDSVCVLMRSALNFLATTKAGPKQQLHSSDVAPLPLFVASSASHKAAVTAAAICDVCSIILHNLSLLPANHSPLSSLQCTIALLSACANAQLCPAVALRSANVLAALTRAGALSTIDPVRWAWAIEGLLAYAVGREVAGHSDPDVLEMSFGSDLSAVVCVGLASSAHTDAADVAAASLNLIIVAATSGVCLLSANVTRHTSHVTRHTSHVTRHTSLRPPVLSNPSCDIGCCARRVRPRLQRQCNSVQVTAVHAPCDAAFQASSGILSINFCNTLCPAPGKLWALCIISSLRGRRTLLLLNRRFHRISGGGGGGGGA